MRRAALLFLLAAASSEEPEGRRPVIPPGDPFPECGTGRVWTGPLRVRVVAKGAPVEGIKVVLGSGIGCTTDAQGIARFQSADSTDTVRIRAVGYHPFEDSVPDIDEELLVELRPGVAVRGRVRLPDGTPAKGAQAACFNEFGRESDAPQVVDEEGRFAILAVDRAKPFRLIVGLDGFAPLVVEKVLLREQPELELRFGGPSGIEGVVTPPSDVWVRAAHESNPMRLERWRESDRTRIQMETAFARADATGRYRIDGLRVPGTYVVCAGPNESAVVELSEKRPRATVDLSGAAPPARSIRILLEDGKPLAKQWIRLLGSTREERAETSDDGQVDLPPGEWAVDVWGYVAARAAPEVTLQKGITVRGVVERDGKPVPGTGVILAQPVPDGRYRFHVLTADAQGRFEIAGQVEGDAWLNASEEPEGPADGRIRIRAGMEDLRVALPAAAQVAGRLLPPPSEILYGGDGSAVARLGLDGSFRVEGLPPGRDVLVDLRLDGGRGRVEVLGSNLVAGETLDLGTFRLDAQAVIEGVVQDPGGRPIECARVHLAVGDPYEPTWTDEKGGFSVDVRPATPVVLEVGAPGFAARYVPVAKPGGEPVRLVLDPGALVRGRVVGADGRAVPGAYIVFWRRLASGHLSPYEDWKPETDSAGRFEIRLPPGTFHARYYDMGRSHARIPGPDVTVRGGETIDLEIRLP